jgi:exopolysaccharide biosynthesis polyprenyl glycosylphosphotransferase
VVQESRSARTVADHPASRPVRLPILGSTEFLADGIARYRVTMLVLSLPQQLESRLLQVLMECVERGIQVVPMSALYEQLTGRVPVEHLQENWYVALPVHHRDHSPLWRFFKRVMDIVLAGIGLLALGAILPIIAIALLVDSRGPLFYTQPRVGKGGRLFRVYKFRSMRLDAEHGSAMWAQENDPRTTRLGRLLRATHVDELPQLLNVLRGEMSAVGPRPERPEFVRALAAAAPFYPLRHTVKPGMAGWALVKQGYASTPEDLLVRLQYDFYYIKHQSLWFDLLILCKTFWHAVGFRGR